MTAIYGVVALLCVAVIVLFWVLYLDGIFGDWE